jgi:hypothetical protein
MENHNISRVLAVTASIVVLLLLFAFYRARGFHYCAEEEEFRARVVSSDEPCGPDESPLEWNRLGWASKLKLIGNTAAKAVGAN